MLNIEQQIDTFNGLHSNIKSTKKIDLDNLNFYTKPQLFRKLFLELSNQTKENLVDIFKNSDNKLVIKELNKFDEIIDLISTEASDNDIEELDIDEISYFKEAILTYFDSLYWLSELDIHKEGNQNYTDDMYLISQLSDVKNIDVAIAIDYLNYISRQKWINLNELYIVLDKYIMHSVLASYSWAKTTNEFDIIHNYSNEQVFAELEKFS